MNQAQLEALLGRPLTSVEVTNLDLYLEIANETLERLICTSIEPVTETRTFNTRKGYRTAFVDIFTNVTEVKVNDVVLDASDYSIRQWDKRNGSWYNSIVLERRIANTCTEIEVTGDWGFALGEGGAYIVPADLQSALAGLFSLVTKKNKLNSAVKSKQVEDFRITFADNVNLDEEFRTTYGSIIDKYSLCNIGYVRHGEVYYGHRI